MAEEEKKIPQNRKEKKKKNLFHRIVNVFLYFFLAILVLLLIVVGITQTSTFREFVRKTAIEEVNKALNGKLYVEKIEGTILTSVILRNTILTLDKDTLLKASLIEVKTSPLQLLFKKIFTRKVLIQDAEINLIKEKNGDLNISRLVPPTPKDTAKSEFPFSISASDIELKNVNFRFQRYDYRGSHDNYDSLYMNDFRINNLNLSLSAYADIKNNDYDLGLKSFSLETNINNFLIKEISGHFKVNKDGMHADNLKIRTAASNILINASLTDYNLFDSTADISNALISLDAKADKFDFADLSTFVPSVSILDDAINFSINTSGSFKELEVNNVEVQYLSTYLKLSGKIRDLDDPENMYITAEFENSKVNIPDINSLMPSLNLDPRYADAGIIYFDTLHYLGHPVDFKTHFFARTDVGNLYASANLDFSSGKDMVYDINFKTFNLNIAPFAGVKSDLNSSGEIKGTGTNPARMNTTLNFKADGSVIAGNRISSLELKSDARNKVVNYELYAQKDTSEVRLQGFFDFTKNDNPSYQFKGYGNNINLQDYTADTTFSSDINFRIDGTGTSFKPENLDLFVNFNVFDSWLNGNHIDSTRAIVDIRKDDKGSRVINIISDLADISITGNYQLVKTVKLINKEIQLLSSVINQKLNDIIPTTDTLISKTVTLSKEETREFAETDSDSLTHIKYLVDLKDFTLATLFLGKSQLEINGELFGDLINTGDSIIINFGISLDYIKFKTPESAMFLSNLKLDFNLRNTLAAKTFSDVSSKLQLTVDRIFAGSDVRDLKLNLDLKNNSTAIDLAANYNGNTNARLVGGFRFNERKVNLQLDTLKVAYNKLQLINSGPVKIDYSSEGINFENFNLVRNGSTISIAGSLLKGSGQDLVFSIKNVNLGDVLTNAFGSKAESAINAVLSLNTHITGSMAAPDIKLDMAVDSVSYSNKIFGSLITQAQYNDKKAVFNLKFIERSTKKEALLIKGDIPINLAFAGADSNAFQAGPMDISLKAENFDLGTFGDLLPEVDRMTGFFSASLNVSGTPQNIQPSGYLALRDVSFLAEANNLTYQTGVKVTIEGNNITLDSLVLKNGPDVPDGGTITGSGRAQLDNFSLKTADISIGGRLKVLSQNSRYAESPVYGDLVIATRGNVDFTINENGMNLNAPVSIKKADLTIPPTQSSYQNTNRSFVYKFVQDTTDTLSGRMDFQSLIDYNQKVNSDVNTAAKKMQFDYNIDLEVEDEARIVFVLSREINQNLTAVLRGNVLYASTHGRSNIQGELNLLDGSTLEFIRTLKAEGSIRFESDITNPSLDITATYQDYYTPPDSSEGTNEIQVAVKIKIKGPLKELDKNFVKEQNNIAVYYGLKNIEDDVPDPTKDASDAVMFMITGRFSQDLNQRERTAATNQFTNAAASIAGSLLGGVLNNYLGDYVSGVELRKVGNDTKFVFSGKAGGFRYSVGGTQDVFQNVSQANVRIEYPVYKGLSLRFERREDLQDRSVINEMINELGLRYRFEF